MILKAGAGTSSFNVCGMIKRVKTDTSGKKMYPRPKKPVGLVRVHEMSGIFVTDAVETTKVDLRATRSSFARLVRLVRQSFGIVT